MAVIGKKRFSLWPLLGFISGRKRQDVPLNALTTGSTDWLVGRQRLVRRAGTAAVTSGVLESKWTARARRMVAMTLASAIDKFATPVILFVYEASRYATLCFRSTNGSDTWRTIGKEFSATTYPDTGVPYHRVMPFVYENQYGGLTVHRFNTAEYRAHALAGSRNILQVAGKVIWGGYRSMGGQWDGRFYDGTSVDPYHVFPLGMIPPLQVPVASVGNALSGSGPWKGSEAFFHTLLFENDKGELSFFAIPRPPGSAWSTYAGFGYMQVNSSALTTYYDSIVYTSIADGPPGTRFKWLLRSTKVDLAATGAGAVLVPSLGTLSLVAKIPQGVTTYTDTNGNDLTLDPDPRILDMVAGGLQWPPKAADVGRFDGHVTLGKLRPAPAALLIAPWGTGSINAKIDDSSLYGATNYFVSIEPTLIRLRSVTGGVATDTTYTLADRTLRQLVDQINANTTDATVTLGSITFPALPLGLFGSWMSRASAFTGVAVGDRVSNAKYPSNTVVTSVGAVIAGTYYIQVSNYPTSASAGGGENVSFLRPGVGATFPWAAGVVPGADAEESCSSLLRTRVATVCTYSNHSTTINVGSASDAAFISPGMVIAAVDWPSGTKVIAVNGTVVTTDTQSAGVAGSGSSVGFGYDTGDITLGLAAGMIRMFGNAWPALVFWRKSYLDRFEDSPQDTIFTAATPGYAQDGLNTWMQRNRQGGPTTFGQVVGPADLGPVEIQFYARGRMRLINPRTGTTHADQDYQKHVVSWTRGARSPYAICQGNGWAIFVSDDGVFACDAGSGEACLSIAPDGKPALYDPNAPLGARGELEYAILASIAASESDSDDYKVFAQVHGSVLSIRYFKDANDTYPSREVRYDFSSSVGRYGIAELLQPDGRTYPWSTPLKLRVSCSAWMAQVDGSVHHYAAVDSNADATYDGVVIEMDTGTADIGAVAVAPVGYTGVALADDLQKLQPTVVRTAVTIPGSGFDLGLTTEPEKEAASAGWGDVHSPTSGSNAFGRSITRLTGTNAAKRIALAARLTDDGSGSGCEVSSAIVDCDIHESVED